MDAILREIGLTDSEQKVYRALLELGVATRGALVTRSGIAGSKIYENLQKLQDKGLLSTYVENKVKHFRAADPKQLLRYLDERKKELEKVEQEAKSLVPQLKTLLNSGSTSDEVELFSGLKGFELVFGDQLDEMRAGEINCVIGGTQSVGEDAVVAFFRRIHIKREEKKIKTRMLFNKSQRKIVESYYNQKEFGHTQNRFIEHSGPVAINIYHDKTVIAIYGKRITAIRITSPSVADSFREYFELLWKTAAS